MNIQSELSGNLVRLLGAGGIALAVLGAGGCAISDEGAVDYRVTATSTPAEREVAMIGGSAGSGPATVETPLVHKFIEPPNAEDTVFEAQDSISIRLSQAFVADFIELTNPLTGRENGEIAIVVHAFEYGTGQNAEFDFSPQGVDKGRLVYYSPDVEEGQFANMANLPIYGPITYHGHPIGLDISVIELDSQNSEQIKVLLGTLAEAGGKAYPPAAPILPLLNQLGSALLAGGTDDTVMRYSIVLDPDSDFDGVAYAKLRAGNYVFLREKDRTANTPWNALTLDENSGRLRCKDGADAVCDADGLYRANTYLVFQVNKGLDSTDIDLSQYTFASLKATLDEIDMDKAKELEKVKDSIVQLAQGRVQQRNFVAARKLMNAFFAAQAAMPPKEDDSKRIAFDLYNLLSAAVTDLTAAPTPKVAEASLSRSQVTLLLTRLRGHGNVTAAADLAKFTVDGFSGFGGFDNFYELAKKKP